MQYQGDIPAAIRDAFDDVAKKPLLQLQDPGQTTETQEQWLTRSDVIEDQIKERTHRNQREPLIGRGGEIIRKKSRNKKKLPKAIYSATKTQSRRPEDDIASEEFRDEISILQKVINSGDTVVQLYGNSDTTTVAFLLEKVGEHGTVHYHAATSRLRERLHEGLFKAFAYDQEILGENAHIGKWGKLSEGFSSNLRDFLVSPYVTDLAMYTNGYSDKDLLGLVSDFYDQYPLFPSQELVLPYLQSLRSGTVDVVLEMDRFARIPEEEKEAVLWEIDRLLKPGGKIAIRENSREQASLEYYGQDVFSKDYYHTTRTDSLKHPKRWITLRKLPAQHQVRVFAANESLPVKEQVELTVAHETISVSKKEELGRAVYREMQQRENEQPEGQSETPSLSWFKNNGLLQALVIEFGGDIQSAVSFAMEQNKPTTLSHAPTSVPKEAQSSYGLADIAREIGVSQIIVKEVLAKMGIKRQKVKGFGKSARQLKQQNFSYAEVQIIKNYVKEQDLVNKEAERRKNG